jgi:hypothetical protein
MPHVSSMLNRGGHRWDANGACIGIFRDQVEQHGLAVGGGEGREKRCHLRLDLATEHGLRDVVVSEVHALRIWGAWRNRK